MTPKNEHDAEHLEHADPDWFRAPTPRERRIAAALFIGFGISFLALFVVLSGWWFRWVILVLGGYSIVAGVRHLRGFRAG
jgi:fatty acid desaturase